MKIILNGEERLLENSPTLAQLVEQLGMKADRVAIERNRNIVPRNDWPTTQIQDGDRLEIVHFVGGGTGNWNAFPEPQPALALA